MRMEIGSFYEMEEVKADADKVSIFDYIGGVLSGKGCYLSSGREAIEAAIMCIEKNANIKKSCILPLYTCDTVVIPFVEHGFDIWFYDIDETLNVDTEKLSQLYNKVKPGVMLLHTYYGCDNIVSVREMINDLRKRDGLVVIEDFTQSLFLMDRVIPVANYYVGSLRKWFPVPDGGFILSDSKIEVATSGENSEYVDMKNEAQCLKYRYLQGLVPDKERALALNRKSEDYLYEMDCLYDMSKTAAEKLSIIDIRVIVSRRNENAAYLINNISNLNKIKNLISVRDEAPLYVPVLCKSNKERDSLQTLLRDNNVFAPVLWPVPVECEKFMSENTERIYSCMLALPCDHRYNLRDMEYIVELLDKFEYISC